MGFQWQYQVHRIGFGKELFKYHPQRQVAGADTTQHATADNGFITIHVYVYILERVLVSISDNLWKQSSDTSTSYVCIFNMAKRLYH